MLLNSPESLSIKYLLRRIYYFLFNPNSLGKVIMLWTGNYVVFFLIILIIWRFPLIRHIKSFNLFKNFILLSLLPIIFAIYYSFSMADPDGNYFIFPLILASLIILLLIYDQFELKNLSKKTLITCVSMFLVINLMIMFVSHSSWSYGTKSFSTEMFINNFDTKASNENVFISNGVSNIAGYIEQNLQKEKVIFYGGDEQVLQRIQSRIESLDHVIGGYFADNSIVNSYESFKRYAEYTNIKGFIISEKYLNKEDKVLDYIKKYISEKGQVKFIKDVDYSFYQVN